MRRPLAGAWLAGAALLAGCKLTEVTTSPSENLLVVEAVLRAGEPIQRVLLHRSLHDGTREEIGAQVTVTASDGRAFRFNQAPLNACTEKSGEERLDSIARGATCYLAPFSSPAWVRPGQSYELTVVTRAGDVVRGRTTVPGEFHLRSPRFSGPRPSTCWIPPETSLPLEWTVAKGSWSYLAVLVIHDLDVGLRKLGIDAPSRLELTGLAISANDTVLVLPTDFGLFERFDIDDDILIAIRNGLPEGTHLELAVVAADRNYVNAVRGGGFNPSGHVRLSSVVGDGIGFFGSLVPLQFNVVVGNTPAFPRCEVPT